jgi:hypothetical protein
MPLPAKNYDTRSAERAGAISPQLPSLAPQSNNKPFQHLHVECLINSGPFGYKLKVDDTPDVEKAEQHCLYLGLSHPWLLWPGGIVRSPVHQHKISIHSLFHRKLYFQVWTKLTQ